MKILEFNMEKSQTANSLGPHGSGMTLASKEATPTGSPHSGGPVNIDLNFGKS